MIIILLWLFRETALAFISVTTLPVTLPKKFLSHPNSPLPLSRSISAETFPEITFPVILCTLTIASLSAPVSNSIFFTLIFSAPFGSSISISLGSLKLTFLFHFTGSPAFILCLKVTIVTFERLKSDVMLVSFRMLSLRAV